MHVSYHVPSFRLALQMPSGMAGVVAERASATLHQGAAVPWAATLHHSDGERGTFWFRVPDTSNAKCKCRQNGGGWRDWTQTVQMANGWWRTGSVGPFLGKAMSTTDYWNTVKQTNKQAGGVPKAPATIRAGALSVIPRMSRAAGLMALA